MAPIYGLSKPIHFALWLCSFSVTSRVYFSISCFDQWNVVEIMLCQFQARGLKKPWAFSVLLLEPCHCHMSKYCPAYCRMRVQTPQPGLCQSSLQPQIYEVWEPDQDEQNCWHNAWMGPVKTSWHRVLWAIMFIIWSQWVWQSSVTIYNNKLIHSPV